VIWGNFAEISGAFEIRTIDEDIVKEFKDALARHQSSLAYQNMKAKRLLQKEQKTWQNSGNLLPK
jgi:hypothetical protein